MPSKNTRSTKSVFTSPSPTGAGWIVQKGGKTLSSHRTKAAAQKKGRAVAKREETEHIIQNRQGQISARNSYGGDPRARKG